MNDVFLGIIAVAVAVMAIIQVAMIVVATRAARRVGEVVSRFEQDVRPVLANLQSLSTEARPILANLQDVVTEARPIMASLQTMAADAARATSSAAAQLERAETLITNFLKRIDGVMTSLQGTVLKPARQGFAVFQGIKAALAVFRDPTPRDTGARRRAPVVEEEDALFIG